jgi:hypothetical protein
MPGDFNSGTTMKDCGVWGGLDPPKPHRNLNVTPKLADTQKTLGVDFLDF